MGNKNFEEDLYEKSLLLIKEANFDKLSKLYNAKREEFLNKIKKENHEEVNNRLIHVVLSLALCIKTYENYVKSVHQKAEELKDNVLNKFDSFKSVSDHALNNLQDLLDEVKSTDKSDFDEEYIKIIKFRKSVYDYVINSQGDLAELTETTSKISFYLLTTSYSIAYHTLIDILETNNYSVVRDLVNIMVKNLIGLIPIYGDVASFLLDLHTLNNTQAKLYKKTSDDLSMLDNFSQSLFHWCIITQLLVENNENKLTGNDFSVNKDEFSIDKNLLDRVSDIVQTRYNQIFEIYNSGSNA